MNFIIKNIVYSFIFLIFFNSCNIEKLKSGQIGGEQKSFILLSNNYFNNRYQVRIVDDSSLNNIKTELLVSVFSNKKVIDLDGHYKSDFKTTNGFVDFAIDPNEIISSTDSLYLTIVSRDLNQKYVYTSIKKTYGTSGKKIILLNQGKFKNPSFALNNVQNQNGYKSNSDGIKSNGISPLTIKSNYVSYELDSTGKSVLVKKPTYLFQLLDDDNGSEPDYRYNNYYVYVDYFAILNNELLNKNLLINFVRNPDYIVEGDIYIENFLTLGDIAYKGSFNSQGYYNSNRGYQNANAIFDQGIVLNNFKKYQSPYIYLEAIKEYGLKGCPKGVNFSFSGIPAGAYPNFLYKQTFANSNKIRALGIANPIKKDSVYNTGMINLPTENTYLDFYSTQYDITPTKAILNSNSCNSTLQFFVKPKAELFKTTILLKATCENISNSVAPECTFEMSKNATPLNESFDVENGISVLYLDPTAQYNFAGSKGDVKYDFNISLDFQKIETLRQQTLAANPKLKDIVIKLNRVDDKKECVININFIFKNGNCPF